MGARNQREAHQQAAGGIQKVGRPSRLAESLGRKLPIVRDYSHAEVFAGRDRKFVRSSAEWRNHPALAVLVCRGYLPGHVYDLINRRLDGSFRDHSGHSSIFLNLKAGLVYQLVLEVGRNLAATVQHLKPVRVFSLMKFKAIMSAARFHSR